MLRAAELSVFIAPLLAFVLWRVSVARGVKGPPTRQLVAIFIALLVLGLGLGWYSSEDALPPGRYVPASVQNGKLIPGHSE